MSDKKVQVGTVSCEIVADAVEGAILSLCHEPGEGARHVTYGYSPADGGGTTKGVYQFKDQQDAYLARTLFSPNEKIHLHEVAEAAKGIRRAAERLLMVTAESYSTV